MRVTQHSGRIHRSGQTYSTRHNDRNFESAAENIDSKKTADNLEWTWCKNRYPVLTFDEAELKFYEKFYQKQLDATNEKYIKGRHREKVKTMDAWRKQKKHAPEELIIQIGKIGEKPDLETFKLCFMQYLDELNRWNDEHGNCMHILDWALHQDEIGAPHVHLRRVWDYYNGESGQLEIGQEKALEVAGVKLPKPEEAPGHYNNRKMTFDAEMRTVWQNIAKANGLEIESKPLPKNEVGMSLDQKIRQNEEKRAFLLREVEQEQQQLEIREKNICSTELQLETELKTLKTERLKLEEEKSIFAYEKKVLKVREKDVEKILLQKSEVEKAKKEFEVSEKESEEFAKNIDEPVKPLPELARVSDIATVQALEKNYPTHKTGTFSHENPYEYANRMTNLIFDWLRTKYYEPLREKCNSFLRVIKDLKRDNELKKAHINTLERENRMLKNSVDEVIDQRLKDRTEALLERGRNEYKAKYEELYGSVYSDPVTFKSEKGIKCTAKNGLLTYAQRITDEFTRFKKMTPQQFRNWYDNEHNQGMEFDR